MSKQGWLRTTSEMPPDLCLSVNAKLGAIDFLSVFVYFSSVAGGSP
jgi:hypothetical protein